MRHFILFLKSFFSPTPYAEAVRGRLSLGWMLLTQYLLLWIIAVIGLAVSYTFILKAAAPYISQVPTIEIDHGQLITKAAKLFPLPQSKADIAAKKPQVYIAQIDPNMTYKQVLDIKEPTAVMYIVKDGFVTYKKHESRIFKYDDMKQEKITLTSDQMSYFIKMGIVFGAIGLMIVLPLMFPFMLLGLCLPVFYSLILAVLIVWLFGETPRIAKTFALTWVILVPALVWEGVINHVLTFPIYQPLFFLAFGLLILVGLKYFFKHEAVKTIVE